MRQVHTPQISRDVFLRENGPDEGTWGDTFTAQYHLPPDWMPTPGTVLDLGANIGLTAAHYAHLWPQANIVAVELDTENATIAQMNAPTVDVRHEAVSTVDARVSYDAERGANAYRLDSMGSGTVQARTLRQIILTAFGGPVDLVKMDVEGTEWGLFEQPDWAELVRYLIVELHGADDAPDLLVAHGLRCLRDLGFTAARHEPHPAAIFAWR